MLKSKLVFDATNTADSDSVGAYLRSSDGTLITKTNVGGKDGLDVNLINTSIVVTATDLDIRDLDASQDNIAISDGTDTLAINADGSVNITDNGGSLTVDATNLDIRDLSHAQDSVRIGDGTDLALVSAAGELQVRDNDANTSLDNIETAVQLLDNIVYADNGTFTDGASQGAMILAVSDTNTFQPLRVNASSELLVSAAVNFAGDYAEDSAHVSGDVGLFSLSVRQDVAAASTSTDGDYQAFKTDALGRMYTYGSGQAGAYAAVSVGATATDIVAADLSNRRTIMLMNNSNRTVYWGSDASVTTANGMPLSPGAGVTIDIGAGVNLHGITASGTADVRYFGLA